MNTNFGFYDLPFAIDLVILDFKFLFNFRAPQGMMAKGSMH